MRKGSVTVFMYHDIYGSEALKYKKRYKLSSFLSVPQFESQLLYIVSNYKIISSSQLLDLDISSIDANYAVLTFDDGLLSHYINVLPLLKAYRVSGTFLIPGAPILDNSIIQSHKIQFILSNSKNESTLIDRIKNKLILTDEDFIVLWNKFSVSKYKNNLWTKEMVFVTNFLRHCSNNKYPLVDELFEELVTKDSISFSKKFYLSLNHIHELLAAGMDVGGHGYTSEDLSAMGQEDMLYDITKSLDFIKRINPFSPILFSYPNGNYTQDVLSTLKGANCSMAFTTKSSFVEYGGSVDYLQIPRFNTLSQV